jgi:hypothetical protein
MRCADAVFVAVIALGTLVPPTAHAGEAKDACFDSYVQAQRLRKDGKLRAAREQLLVCAASTCPAMVKNDCARWTGEVERGLPTVVFTAKDDRGQDMVDVQVFVDDQRVTDHIDGRAVPADPGPHTVRFEASSKRRVELKVVLAEGDSNRRLEGHMPPPEPAPRGAPPPARWHIPTATLALGGVAIVGLVSFTAFALTGKQKEACAPTCTQSDVDSLRTDYAIADVSWILGLAAAAGAVYFYVKEPKPGAAPPTTGKATSIGIEARPTPGGATIGLRGSFL